jgi:peptide methionine sulfoxide reductase msrA/msrB
MASWNLWNRRGRLLSMTVLVALLSLISVGSTKALAQSPSSDDRPSDSSLLLAGGCFWCVESDLEKLDGVIEVVSGYTGGKSANPTYENYANRGHREAVLVTFDPKKITYAGVLEYFLKHIDPIDRGGSFIDRGPQYRAAIYYQTGEQKKEAERVIRGIEGLGVLRKPISIPLLPAGRFWLAEPKHQDYHRTNETAYGTYRQGCGRDDYVRKTWGDRAKLLELPGARPDAEPKNERDESPAPDARQEEPMEESGKPRWVDFRKPPVKELKQRLSPLQFRVTQSNATEDPFRNPYWNNHEQGIYVDIVSGEPLFASADKFDSGTGWPSFVRPIDPEGLVYKEDYELGQPRIEVRSKWADSHLGHVFQDGPPQRGGLRYCINSASLRFVPKASMQQEGYEAYLKWLEP